MKIKIHKNSIRKDVGEITFNNEKQLKKFVEIIKSKEYSFQINSKNIRIS